MTISPRLARHSRQLLLCASIALAAGGSAFAQSSSSAPKAAPADEGGYSKWDVSPFIGWQWFQMFQGSNLREHQYENGVVYGGRVTQDFSRYFSLEEYLAEGHNRLDLKPYGNPGFMSISARNTQIAVDLVFHFAPRTSKIRPFALVGPGYTWYTPGDISSARQPPTGTFIPPSNTMITRGEVGITYGLGVKLNLNKKFGLRFDMRGMSTNAAHMNLPNAPGALGSLWIKKGTESSLMAQVGVVFRFAYVEPPPPPNPLINQTLRIDVPAAGGGGLAVTGAHDVCPGDDLRVQVNAAGFTNPTYRWSVNGTAAAGGNAAAFSVPTAGASGARTVTVAVGGGTVTATSAPFNTEASHTYHLTAEAAGLNGRSATYQWMSNGQPVSGATGSSYDVGMGAPAAITVRATVPNPEATASANFNITNTAAPTITFAVNPSTMPYTAPPVPLSATSPASACGGAVTIRYSGEGVTGSTFNPGSVSGFDMGNRVRQQSKVVRLTATATNARNQTASANADVTVTLGTEARRLDDVVFQSMSSRVNNCGKRLLLEELTPMLRNDPGAHVILIGHRDAKEKGNKAALALDTTRVMNAAAVLSAGKGICPQLDLSRIMMQAAGTDQSATPRPSLCGSSTNVKEKAGQAVKESDKDAQFRRVEVWFVPSGAANPTGVNATPVPAADVTKLGCPK